jgi:hypothetical protein
MLLRISIVVPRLVMLAASTNIRVSASTSSTNTAIAAKTSIKVNPMREQDLLAGALMARPPLVWPESPG